MDNNGFRHLSAQIQGMARSAVLTAADEMKSEMKQQLRSSFKSRGRDSKGFFHAVSVRPKANPTEKESLSPIYDPNLPPVAYVYMGLKFMVAFEFALTITPRNAARLLVRLPSAQKLGFPKPGDKRWKSWYPQNKKYLVLLKSGSKSVLAWQPKKDQAPIPVYVFLRAVKMPKKLRFFDAAQRIGSKLDVTLGEMFDKSKE
jgi:hypothetical protein